MPIPAEQAVGRVAARAGQHRTHVRSSPPHPPALDPAPGSPHPAQEPHSGGEGRGPVPGPRRYSRSTPSDSTARLTTLRLDPIDRIAQFSMHHRGRDDPPGGKIRLAPVEGGKQFGLTRHGRIPIGGPLMVRCVVHEKKHTGLPPRVPARSCLPYGPSRSPGGVHSIGHSLAAESPNGLQLGGVDRDDLERRGFEFDAVGAGSR